MTFLCWFTCGFFLPSIRCGYFMPDIRLPKTACVCVEFEDKCELKVVNFVRCVARFGSIV